jgi:hypothetical protein
VLIKRRNTGRRWSIRRGAIERKFALLIERRWVSRKI